MTDAAFQNAIARRDALAKEINELNQRIEDARREMARVDAFLDTWREFAKDTAPEGAKTENTPRITPMKPPRPVNPPKERIGDLVERLMRSEQRPVTRKEIQKYLQSVDIHLQGTDPDMVLSTMLWRMPHRFQRVKPHGYWFADQPLPPPPGSDLI